MNKSYATNFYLYIDPSPSQYIINMFSLPATIVLLLGCNTNLYSIDSVTAFLPVTVSTRNIRSSSTSQVYLADTKKKTVFIDGEAGTTGIQVRDRLGKRDDIEILSIPDAQRKDVDARKEYINKADAVILCTFH